MSKPWFHPETGLLQFDAYVAEMPSFQRIMADNVITDDEMRAQAEHVIARFKALEAALTPEQRDLAGEALCELAVLNSLYQRRMEG